MPTLLIVDDDSVDREQARRCLEKVEGLGIVYAHDGVEALEAIAAGAPDLILTDLRMPRMDGLELVEKVREDHSHLPIILMTSQGNEKIAVKALKAGAASYVPKSDLKESLQEIVEQVLEVLEARRSQSDVLRYLEVAETRFELDNDPGLIGPLAGFLQGNLERLGFATDPVRTQVGIALMEAVTNAMIHGNLEMGSDLRRTDKRRYYEMIDERRGVSPYASRRVRCTAREAADRVEYVIEDQGPGFDPQTLPDPTDAANLLAVSGRGIMLIRTFMDQVAYNDRGNRLEMSKSAT